MKIKGRRGQNVIEYILLFVTVLLLFIIFLNPKGPYATGVESTVFNSMTQQLNNLNSEIQF